MSDVATLSKEMTSRLLCDESFIINEVKVFFCKACNRNGSPFLPIEDNGRVTKSTVALKRLDDVTPVRNYESFIFICSGCECTNQENRQVSFKGKDTCWFENIYVYKCRLIISICSPFTTLSIFNGVFFPFLTEDVVCIIQWNGCSWRHFCFIFPEKWAFVEKAATATNTWRKQQGTSWRIYLDFRPQQCVTEL